MNSLRNYNKKQRGLFCAGRRWVAAGKDAFCRADCETADRREGFYPLLAVCQVIIPAAKRTVFFIVPASVLMASALRRTLRHLNTGRLVYTDA